MAKSSRKRIARNEKDQSGCMWGFINIFDFRHGQPSQKLLSDKKHGSRRVAGATYPDNKVEDLKHSAEDNEEIGTVPVVDTSKRSVKKLMEEEMFQLEHRKQMVDVREEDQKQSLEVQQKGLGKRNRSRRSKMSFDLNDSISVPNKPTHRKHKSLSSLDVDNMVAELCTQIQHQDVNILNDEATSQGLLNLSEEESSVVEAKLGEATKVLVRHFIDGRNFARDGKVQPSNELLEALNVLNLNKDIFLKLLQDPDSQLVKHINNLQDHLDDKHENSFEKLDKGTNRHESFFWRKFKGLERNPSKKAEVAEDTSNIVVLKPELFVSRERENEFQSEKASSPRFSFFAFTRKLKRAMRKEQSNTSNVEKGVGEGFSLASPSREHFFIEKLPRSPLGSKRVDKVPSDIGSTPEQRISDIYIEAKKHLAEIVGGGVDVDFSGRQVPKSLGRILSYADYSSSPLCSPRKESTDRSLLTSPRALSPRKECQAVNEVASGQVQGEIDTCPANSAEENRDNGLCTVDDKFVSDSDILKSEVSAEIYHDCRVNESTTSAVQKAQVQDGIEIITSNRPSEKSIFPDTISESCSTSVTKNKQVDELVEDCMKRQPGGVNLDLVGNESTSSPFASPSILGSFKDDEDHYVVIDRPDEPSPISVLDPIVNEDVHSPTNAKSVSAIGQQIQPRKIKFEEPSFSSITCSGRWWVWEDEKSSVFELVKVVMQESGLTWDEIYEKSLLSDHVLEPSFFDELEFIPDLLSYDPQLLLDLISEVLDEMGRRNVSGILSSHSPHIAPEIRGKDVMEALWEGVEWHLQPDHGLPRTLDQIIIKDYAKSGRWIDLRMHREVIGTGMEEAIFDELVEDSILNCFCWNPEDEISVLAVELKNESE